MQNPWKELSVKEWWLWSISMLIVTVSNLVGGSFDVLTLAATWVSITSLIFAAKGNVSDGRIQHPVRHHLVPLSLLG